MFNNFLRLVILLLYRASTISIFASVPPLSDDLPLNIIELPITTYSKFMDLEELFQQFDFDMKSFFGLNLSKFDYSLNSRIL